MATVFDVDADPAVGLWWEGVEIDSVWVLGVSVWRVGYPSFEFGICGIGQLLIAWLGLLAFE